MCTDILKHIPNTISNHMYIIEAVDTPTQNHIWTKTIYDKNKVDHHIILTEINISIYF